MRNYAGVGPKNHMRLAKSSYAACQNSQKIRYEPRFLSQIRLLYFGIKKTKNMKSFLLKDPLQSLKYEDTRRFQNFKKIKPKFYIFCYPITAGIDTALEELRLELIDLKSSHSIKKIFNAMIMTLTSHCQLRNIHV
ncbi:hypothetical protein TNCV_335351 [Trichonephila clavipes]|nr:hypothetical protein TNCV_335351 [Trichonephila clavipes]